MKLVFLSIIALISSVKCIFEDQAGTYDWRQQYIGRPLFTRVDSNRNKIFLATDKRLLCALNKKSGVIVWRKIFENNELGDVNHVLWAKNEIVLINGNGKHIQTFNYNHGYVTREFSLFKNNSESLNYQLIESKVESEAYYASNGYELCYLNAKDRFCTDLPTESGHSFGNIYESEHGVFAIGLSDKSIVKVQFNGLLSRILSKTSLDLKSGAGVSSRKLFNVESNQLYQLINNQELQISDVKVENLEFKSYQLPYQLSDDYKLVHKSSKTLLFDDEVNKKLYLFQLNKESLNYQLLKSYEGYHKYYLTSHDGEQYLVSSKFIGNKLNLYTYNLRTSQERSDLLTTINDAKNVLYIDGSISETKSGESNINHLCFHEDYSLVLYNQNGNKYFTREEALTNIVNVEMLDFPLLTLQEEFEDEFGSSNRNILTMFIRRLKSQFFQLKETLGELPSKVANLLKIAKQSANLNSFNSNINPNAADKEVLLKRDEFNLNKLIIAATSCGKVFGIHSSNGQIIWSFYLNNAIPFQTGHFPFYIQRTSAHYPYEAQAVIIAQLKSDQSKTLVLFFNPLNGLKTKDYQTELVLNFKVKQAYLASVVDSQFLKPLILFDTENKVHILPKTSEELIAKNKIPHVIYVAEKSSLSGYSIKETEKPSSKLWNINLEDESIVAIGSKLPSDRVHSHGKILGDRSVLYKYLNPNIVGIVTEGNDNQKVPFVNLYIVDTVNGNIITSLNHKRAKGPVNIVHSENWFFYSYYNLKFRRHEVTSVELFEGSQQYNSTHFSSFDAIKPVVFTKTYIIQKSFDAMQVTVTEKGIATKDVIVATPFGTIIEIPWILIDARRPFEMTEVEREENLIPYMPELPLNYEFSLNYYNYVYNVRGISTSPSGLESTSLVFVYGLDLFFTRVFPSKTFDMLREDFDYFFIITLMIGLLLGTLISKKLAASSNLSKAWK